MHTTTKAYTSLTDDEKAVFYTAKCPDCGARFVEGPSGGDSINYLCADDSYRSHTNASCGSRFNEMGPFGVERISDASPRRNTALNKLTIEFPSLAHRRQFVDWLGHPAWEKFLERLAELRRSGDDFPAVDADLTEAFRSEDKETTIRVRVTFEPP